MSDMNQEARSTMSIKKEMLGDKVSYLKRDRGYGQGDVRIGGTLGVGEDIYSLGFIA